MNTFLRKCLLMETRLCKICLFLVVLARCSASNFGVSGLKHAQSINTCIHTLTHAHIYGHFSHVKSLKNEIICMYENMTFCLIDSERENASSAVEESSHFLLTFPCYEGITTDVTYQRSIHVDSADTEKQEVTDPCRAFSVSSFVETTAVKLRCIFSAVWNA